MNFEYRIKGDITETIVKALLVDDGYRVIDSGIEHLIREVSCLDQQEYLGLSLSSSIRKLPDLIVMNKNQTTSHLVEVKYRQKWDSRLIFDLEEQVKFFNEITLVCVNGSPVTEQQKISGSTHLRAVELRHKNGEYQVHKYSSKGSGSEDTFSWVTVSQSTVFNWWDLAPMQFVFKEMTSAAHSTDNPKHGTNINTLLACKAIGSLMNPKIWESAPC